MKTHDGLPVETVFIPEERRDTICFSSQSGCPLQCDFCLTAKLGLLRTLDAGEIVEQIIIALNDAYGVGEPTPRGTNLVAMGAGEPFLAFDPLMKALGVMSDTDGLFIVPNRVTVSTAGVVPKIRELAHTPERPHLAISLAAPTDELRDRLMPINKRWPLAELLAACKEFEESLKPGERFTFEYVMLDGVNDSDEQARQLANLLNRHELRAKVNLIPHNPADDLPYQPSTPERVESFKAILESKGVHAFVRRPRGRDIYAACGQLAARRVTRRRGAHASSTLLRVRTTVNRRGHRFRMRRKLYPALAVALLSFAALLAPTTPATADAGHDGRPNGRGCRARAAGKQHRRQRLLLRRPGAAGQHLSGGRRDGDSARPPRQLEQAARQVCRPDRRQG